MRAFFMLWLILAVRSVLGAVEEQAAPVLSVHIQAIRVSDDDGTRPARVTAHQFEQWVDHANRTYAPANIRFLFGQDEGDFGTLKSTFLNKMTGSEDPDWEKERLMCNRIAARYPNKITVLCRYGPGTQGTGGGFSSWDYHFVVMGGFEDMNHCGKPQYGALAHETGHYLGLVHIFPRTFLDEASAEAYLKEHKNNPACFDGDSLADTLPDPSIKPLECDRRQSVTLNGITFELPRHNIMSYYNEGDTISLRQAERARTVLLRRMSNGMRRPSNAGASHPIEAESLRVSDKRECGESIDDMSNWCGEDWSGKVLFCRFGRNGSITLRLPVTQSGQVQVSIYGTKSFDFGKIQTYIDGKAVGEPFDAYSPWVIPTGRIYLGVVELSEGEHKLRFDAVGKNEESAGYMFGLDCVEILP